MSVFSELAVFAVVLAINLLLIGAVLASGIALVFKFTENTSPRIRYYAAVAIFLTATLFPLVAAMRQKDNEIQRQEVPQTSNIIERTNEPNNFSSQNDFSGRRNISFNPRIIDENSSGKFLSEFIARFSDSFYGNTFLSVWILGVVLLFAREVIGLRRLKRERKFWISATERERGVLLCPETVQLYFAENQTPGTVGLFRPAIVLPRSIPAELSLESKRFIVRHELAHVRRFDPLGGLLVRAIRNLFWISPALWLLEKLINAEREAAADRAAISSLQDNKSSETLALNYAETLLLLAKSFSNDRQENQQLPLVGIGSGIELEIRVRRLLSSRCVDHRQTASALGAGLLTAFLLAVIPLAAFSEISKNNRLSFALTENNREIFSSQEKTDEVSRQNKDIALPLAEISEKNDKSNQSDIYLKKLVIKNSAVSDLISTYESEQTANRNLKFADRNEDAEISAKTLSEQDARESELRENQQPAAARSSDLELLPALLSSGDRLKTLQKIRPASELKTVLPEEDKLARQKAMSELDSQRDYPANYPGAAVAPKQKRYETKYIPYPAKRNEQ